MRITDTSDQWWKSAIIYCLDVETFLDADGDGIGDLQGLAQRIDYLAELGITCLWLMPIYPSPDRDDGYDVTDFYGVDRRLGDYGRLVEVVRTAHDRGIRVVVDLLINHTSDQHPWFVSARRGPDSPFRDYYVWRDTEPPDTAKQVVFPDAEESIWTRDEQSGHWYLHHFYAHQPDLNVANPAVVDELLRTIGFWLELGIDGFRVDAVPFFVEDIETTGHPTGDPHEVLRTMRAFLGRRKGDAVLLGEVNLPHEQQREYFGGEAGDELQMMFDFITMQRTYLALARADAGPLVEALTARPALPPGCQWATFLRNHDELTLDKLTEEERQEVFAAFGPEPEMQVYGRGLKRRLPPMLDGDPRRVRLAYSLMFSLPGTPTLFYGEEIGMGEDLAAHGRMAVRTPMQWSDGANGGFSTAPAEQLVQAVVADGYGPRFVNAAAQLHDPDSLLSFVKALISVRRSCPELGWGTLEVVPTEHPAVLVHRCDLDDSSVLAVHNLSADPVTVPVRLGGTEDEHRIIDLLSHEVVSPEGEELEMALAGYGHRWLRLCRGALLSLP
ncbi:trehalose synthase [Desertihabitans brevis]|uniref:Trehalose synthase n=1 Tax=Desertihabitans brevis TaxID=2268447 RepID=A0A367YXV4_9ACTN|nr:alpha-amylase family protein [Desertihabitans brevis]RCK70658.1 trehalose synthase [Desertihabitans brevis]